jgi:anaerobic ribonucleoside-triphosphate reductase activating protein
MATGAQEMEFENGSDVVNVAATCTATRALGPSLRAVVWVQGCPFHCPGCIAPDWIPLRPAQLQTVQSLTETLLSNPDIEGITISGGEPMLQAAALARLCLSLRARKELNIICFTGFRYEQLLQTPPGPGVDDFLGMIDMLIDSPYIERMNDNLGLRGSANQRFIHLTNRLADYDFTNHPRKAEIHLVDGSVQMIGIPSRQLKEAFHQAVDQANRLGMELFQYERV